jgi:hypothetical protein
LSPVLVVTSLEFCSGGGDSLRGADDPSRTKFLQK